MASEKKVRSIEYMCSVCGERRIEPLHAGRPLPGVCRKSANKGPHRWVINKKIMY